METTRTRRRRRFMQDGNWADNMSGSVVDHVRPSISHSPTGPAATATDIRRCWVTGRRQLDLNINANEGQHLGDAVVWSRRCRRRQHSGGLDCVHIPR